MAHAGGLINSPPRVIHGVTLKFPAKLWRITNRCISGAVSWNSNGTAIIIRRELFEDEFLSVTGHFKTTNFTSFVRQLNIYGFRKLMTRQRWYEKDSIFEYYHPYFQRGHPELLPNVVRNAKKLDPVDTSRNQELDEASPSNRLNKVIFVENSDRTTYPNLGTSHPLLISKYNRPIKLKRTKYGGAGDMQCISPTRLHKQVTGVVPGMDESDDDDDESQNFCMKPTNLKTERQGYSTDFTKKYSESSQTCPRKAHSAMVYKNGQNPGMKSPNLNLLSPSSSESNSPKPMELMFSSILPQEDQDADSLANTLRENFDPITVDDTGTEASSNPSYTGSVCSMSMPTDSGDLESYPFPLGDTMLEYNEDDVGVFTPAYFNPSTGMVTLLLPNAAADN